ncbi:hypothetical protein ACRE_067250 [Hapsidospora chrysogenum ATCC 11550]|uniref:Uncharacterized protein n=1 Tax=Hapsidospora chrysogenum (strain ATCC 11550 / CBS 779.69 / DSM 880 / IAM 14645 / JCM 23072 / IMI 49137) TaxID=857340 RepID=A0A086SZK4_HAPC1|nr:hypothetical protein ACRE_067250 [Hapsidospora chrysogenum ATCC 11550]
MISTSNFTLSKRERDLSTDCFFPQSKRGRMDYGPNVATSHAAPYQTTDMNVPDCPPQNMWDQMRGTTHHGARPTREEVLNTLAWDKDARHFLDQSFPGYPTSHSASMAGGMNPSQSAPAPPRYNPDHEVEFELQTSMGMVWRPSPEKSPQNTTFHDIDMFPPTDVGSPSQWLDTQYSPLFNDGGATIPSTSQTQGPNDGLGYAGMATDSRDRGLDQTVQNLDRLEASLQANTRLQMDYVNGDRRSGILQ